MMNRPVAWQPEPISEQRRPLRSQQESSSGHATNKSRNNNGDKSRDDDADAATATTGSRSADTTPSSSSSSSTMSNHRQQRHDPKEGGAPSRRSQQYHHRREQSHPNDDNDDDREVPSTPEGAATASASSLAFPTRGGLPARLARHIASRPYHWLGVTLLVSLTATVYVLFFTDFSITADMKGWWSRGTALAAAQTQNMILQRHHDALQQGDDDDTIWQHVTTTVQPGIDNYLGTGTDEGEDSLRRQRQRRRNLQSSPFVTWGPTGCAGDEELAWYSGGNFFWQDDNLWPIWRMKNNHVSATSAQVIHDICRAEETTQTYLAANGYCGGCTGGDGGGGNNPQKCLPPLSLVYVARLAVFDYRFNMTCDELAKAYGRIERNVTAQLVRCVLDVRAAVVDALRIDNIPASCPYGFSPFLVDQQFGVNGNDIVRVTSSVFATSDALLSSPPTRHVNQLYDHIDQLDTAEEYSDVVTGVYDTRSEHFYDFAVNEAIQQDMILAIAAIVVTVGAMIVHTKSIWLTLAGLVQILVSFPIAYFIYMDILRLEFFPFLNFLGVYVVFAIGADDVFVACDKWKNVRLDHPTATTEQVASIALPDSAKAMFLTSSTTSVAFFGTAICPVTSLKLFSIFVGLLVFLAYILCILFVFPALCLNDQWKRNELVSGQKPSCFVEFCQREAAQEEQQEQRAVDGAEDDDEDRPSLIRRILSAYYCILHFLRYPLLLVFVATFAVSTYYALQLSLPNTSDVRLLSPDTDLEQQFQARLQLFGNELLQEIGGGVNVVWGITPSDTGSPNNPDKSSVLVLDESFDPAPASNQRHLLNFCQDLFNNSFINREFESFECPMTLFDTWLEEQAELNRNNSASEQYTEHCGNSTGVPVDASLFHPCFIHFKEASVNGDSWGIRKSLEGVLSRSGVVRVFQLPFKQSGVGWDIGYKDLDVAWKMLDKVMTEQNAKAPKGVEKAFAASFDYWWYDTNGSLLSTAVGGIYIALGAAFVVLLWSTRSLAITMFAVFTIAFILSTVTAVLVASDWTMGFLEAVCFAILIGISCDFVLHFGHAYCSHPDQTRREERTKKSLTLMGPSILAAAITTIAAAVVMKFANIVFFRKFATILLYTLLMALFGSMTVFLVLTDIFGPANPTAFADYVTGAVSGKPKPVAGAHPSKQSLDPPPTQTYRGKFIEESEGYA